MAKVLTVGLHVADVLGRYVSAIPEGQGLALLDEIRLTVAGTAAATAVNLAKLGVDVDTVGVVGDDALGEFMTRTMTSAGAVARAARIGCCEEAKKGNGCTAKARVTFRHFGGASGISDCGAGSSGLRGR